MKRRPAHRAPRARTRPFGPAVVVLVLVFGVVFLGTFVFPTRSFLAQRSSIAEAREELTVLDAQNHVLADQAAKLKDDAEIERLAREQYNLVRPGEEAYALLPATEPTTTTTTAAAVPAPTVAAKTPDHRNPVRKAWDGLTGLF